MNKNLTWKLVLIILAAALAAVKLYPPDKKLKPGIDLAGGTSLIYEIDAQGLEDEQRDGLAARMITVLRRRVDPTDIQNLIWRPQGDTRFEIQMPLASTDTREKRQAYENALSELLEKNVSPARILRSLQKPADERAAELERLAAGDPNRAEILNTLAKVHDERKALQDMRDRLDAGLAEAARRISDANLDVTGIDSRRAEWAGLDDERLQQAVRTFVGDANDLAGDPNNVVLVVEYVKAYAQRTAAINQLTDTQTGKNRQYREARQRLDNLILSEDQIEKILELDAKDIKRREGIEALMAQFPERRDIIQKVVAAYDAYRPYQGRLDDPRDLQRMLKGAGILEFRILPTQGHPDVDMDAMRRYQELLREKGPTYASDSKYVWCEIERPGEGGRGWRARDAQENETITGEFGGRWYVLAANSPKECLLHGAGTQPWKLEKANPSTDQMGRRAIQFYLDPRGGKLFSAVTGENIGRPLCILLDNLAISAPTIQSKIGTEGQITGTFTQEEVDDMVNKLNAGSLPARLIEQPISVNTIGPSIGADNARQGIRAGYIGLGVVVLIMLGYYLCAGAVADVALLLNVLFILAVMAGLRATFTLPGIAGIILTIGMSVDANVLIFERIREEQQKGSSLRVAIGNGYQRALWTIIDANVTTFLTAAILYFVASEEIKGFAIVLMIGIASSMVTALFVTRVIFDVLLSRGVVKDRIVMLNLIHKPNVNWMGLRPVFMVISLLLIAAGLFAFFSRDDSRNSKYDIEFTGGTSVQITLKEGSALTREDVEKRIQKVGVDQKNALASANVYSVGKTGRQFEINTTETNKIRLTTTLGAGVVMTAGDVTTAILKAQTELRTNLGKLVVTQDPADPKAFMIETSQMSQSAVQAVLTAALPGAEVSDPEVNEVVNDAIRGAFAAELEVQQDLQPTIVSVERITGEVVDAYPELADYLSGVKILCGLGRPASADEIQRRFKDLHFKPDTRDLKWYAYEIVDDRFNPIADPNRTLSAFGYVSVEPEAAFRELTPDEWNRFVENEKTKVVAAAELEATLPRVRQFDPSIGSEQKTRALIAIFLSLVVIVGYIWVRFGNVRYGLAAIVALVHDVCITLGLVVACTYLAGGPVGRLLLIGDFKINLAIVAAFLTLIGYSLNDTIIVFDRIRENRRKAQLNPQTITNSVNQTISRTIMTSFTTFIVVLIMYIFGGENLRGFTFAIGFGVIIGTYSSIAIAAPILLIGTGGSTTAKTAKSRPQ